MSVCPFCGQILTGKYFPPRCDKMAMLENIQGVLDEFKRRGFVTLSESRLIEYPIMPVPDKLQDDTPLGQGFVLEIKSRRNYEKVEGDEEIAVLGGSKFIPSSSTVVSRQRYVHLSYERKNERHDSNVLCNMLLNADRVTLINSLFEVLQTVVR